MKNIILIGLGPHAKKIYLKFIKKNSYNLSLIVDLKSKKESILKYLNDNNIKTNTYFVDDSYANSKTLNKEVKKYLRSYIKNNDIKYAIISTEPKSHFAYASFFLKENINILMDKPITSPIDAINKVSASKQVKSDYLKLLDLYNKSNSNFTVLVQRRFHAGYNYIKKILDDVISKYNIPITYIDIYHSDGMWNMPNEFLERENHPYKYGYGKLFHSGYHFIDILTYLLESNKNSNKDISNINIYTSSYRPSDFLNSIDNNFYKNVFNTNMYDDIFSDISKFKGFGELDFHSMIDFKDSNDNIITNASINLLQNSFSNRAWTKLPSDTYKKNGRIRHERVNIQVGPLLNIQIHSYQSDQNGKINNYSCGDMDHFDIYIFRNTDIIGGKRFEKLSIKDLDSFNDLGNNEKARELCFNDFMNDLKTKSELPKHGKSILLFSKCCESLARGKNIKFEWSSYE